MTDKAYAVPLHELLAGVPRGARLVITDLDGMGTRFIPVGRYCHEAAAELRAKLNGLEKGAGMTDRELLQQALDTLRHLCLHSRAVQGYDAEKVQAGIDALKARLAQPEPVIQARKEGDLIVVDLPQVATGGGGVSKEQEPTAYLCENAVGHKYFRWKKPSSEYKPIALYTAPPQREWVGLTEEEMLEAENGCSYMDAFELTLYAQKIEAKLKEKNGG